MLTRMNVQRPDYLVQATEIVAFAIDFDVSMRKPKGGVGTGRDGRAAREQGFDTPVVSEANKEGAEADTSPG